MNRRNIITAIVAFFLLFSLYKCISPDCKWCNGTGKITSMGYEMQCRDCNGTGKK